MSQDKKAVSGVQAVVTLATLEPSKTNPRSDAELKSGIEDLVASIKEKGVLVPLMVRKAGKALEIIAGHRRAKAAELAGLKVVPVIQYDWSDDEVLEAQLIENLQRKDLHPMDEAKGFMQLVKTPKKGSPAMTLEQAAAKVGKSLAYAKKVTILMQLIPEAQEAYRAGKFGPKLAYALARVANPQLQQKVFKDALQSLKRGYSDEDDIIGHIKHESLCSLTDTIFDPKDPQLVKSAGACTTCPKRAGNQAALFEDVNLKDGDRCMDPQCFGSKVKAALDKRKADAKAKGMKILEGKAADRRHSMIELKDTCWQDAKNRKWSEILKGTDVVKTLVIAERHNGTFEVSEHVDHKDAMAALKADGQTKLVKTLESGRSYNSSGSAKAERRKALLKAKTIKECLRKLAGANKVYKHAKFWRILGKMMAEKGHYMAAKLALEALGLAGTKRTGQYAAGGYDYARPLAAFAAKSEQNGQRVFVLMQAADVEYTNTRLNTILAMGSLNYQKIQKDVVKTEKLLKEKRSSAKK
jgi:ParB/RepB/Spo0J family partition protein